MWVTVPVWIGWGFAGTFIALFCIVLTVEAARWRAQARAVGSRRDRLRARPVRPTSDVLESSGERGLDPSNAHHPLAILASNIECLPGQLHLCDSLTSLSLHGDGAIGDPDDDAFACTFAVFKVDDAGLGRFLGPSGRATPSLTLLDLLVFVNSPRAPGHQPRKDPP